MWVSLGSSGDLVTVDIISIAKHGLPQQAIGVILLLKLPWAVLLRFHASVAHGSCWAAPVHMCPIGTDPSIGAIEVGLPIGSVAWESSQWYHSVLAGGRQKGTSRKTQVCCMFLLRPGPPQAEGDEGDDDEDDRAQDDPDNQVGQVTGACHHGPGAHGPLHGFRGWRLRWSQSRGWESTRLTRRLPSFGLTDHHVAELALPSFIKALHLDVIGGLWLQVADGVPVSISFHHILFVVAIIVTVCGSIIDIKAMDWSVVVTCWNIHPLEHDGGLVHRISKGDVRACHGPLVYAATVARHHVGPGGGAGLALPQHVQSPDSELVGGAFL